MIHHATCQSYFAVKLALRPVTYTTIKLKYLSRLISMVRSISEWLPHWIYYFINTYVFCKQVHFAYIKTNQVFLIIANTTEIVNTCSSITREVITQYPNAKLLYFFFPSKVYSMIPPSYNNLFFFMATFSMKLNFVYEKSTVCFLVKDKCSSWYKRVGDFLVSVWDRRKEILYSNKSTYMAHQNNPTPECMVNDTKCYDG